MTKIKLTTKAGIPDPKEKEIISQGLLAHHTKSGHPRKSEQFTITLKDESGDIKGGIIVTFLWDGMEINSLWVDESQRNQGWGKKLVVSAEQEASKHGAPEFYEKLGYVVYGKLENFPEGNSLTYYMKKLT